MNVVVGWEGKCGSGRFAGISGRENYELLEWKGRGGGRDSCFIGLNGCRCWNLDLKTQLVALISEWEVHDLQVFRGGRLSSLRAQIPSCS